MTGQPQQGYIITEEMLQEICKIIRDDGLPSTSKVIENEVRSHPYQSERERLIANIENWVWVNRSVFFNNNAYNPLIEKLQKLRQAGDSCK